MSGRGTPEYRQPRSARAELSLLINRVECLLLPGKVDQVDYEAAYARVSMKDKDKKGIITDWIRWTESCAGEDREWNPPSVGESVLVFSPTGNMNNAIIVASFNTTDNPPLANSQTLRRKTWGKPSDGDFLDYPFWELEKKQGKEHEWEYLPATGEFRKEIGDKVLVHWTSEFLLWRIGNTQYVLKDGSATMTIADDITDPTVVTEVRMTQDSIELHADHKASISISRGNGELQTVPNVEIQAEGKSAIIVQKLSIEASVNQDACLSLSAGKALLETKTAKAKLSLAVGVSSLVMDGVSVYLSPALLSLNMAGSSLSLVPTSIVLRSAQLLTPARATQAGLGVAIPYIDGGLPAQPHPTLPKDPQAAGERWQLEESKGPYYPRTKKPKE